MKITGFQLLIISILLCMLSACSQQAASDEDIAHIQLDLDFKRIDLDMYNCGKAMIQDQQSPENAFQTYIKPEKGFWDEFLMYPRPVSDEVMAEELVAGFIGSRAVYQLLDTIHKVFPPDYPFETRISPLWKRFSLHFPDQKVPKIRTHVMGYLPEMTPEEIAQTFWGNEYFSLGLDYFLGADLPYYPQNVPQFIRKRYDIRFLEVMVAHEIARRMVLPIDEASDPALLDYVVEAGMRQYVVDQLLPNTPDSLLFFYTDKQMEWANYYEKNIYDELIPLLYEKQGKGLKEYMAEKAFTTHLSQESAPRIGVFAGWKVVQSYMKQHPDMSVADLCKQTDYARIFREARYKP